MSWRLARSLVQLRDEVNALAPTRSRISDGTIGDPAHASRASRHNPNPAGVVCALDITNDVTNGCPIHLLARRIARHPHPNLEYIISDGEIAKRREGFVWRTYTGSNPHTKHAHFAVGVGPDGDPRPPYDDTTPWLATPAQEDFMALSDDEQKELLARTRDLHAVLCNPHDPKYLDKRLASALRDPLAALVRRLAVALGLPVRQSTDLGNGV